MQIEPANITVRELINGYTDQQEQGVRGYGGKLDIRPPFQREFIYGDKECEAVINTVMNNYPLNLMYWAVREDGNYEVIDGQQRTLSICQYAVGKFAYQNMYFDNLKKDETEQILNYKLMVQKCIGTENEKLKWFETINIAGEEHRPQELKNAAYAGTWTADAKLYFSKTNCAAYVLAHDYMNGEPIRQDYLETAIDWISDGQIRDYMGKHKNDASAEELWLYFQNVIAWVQATFTVQRDAMKTVPWGRLYNQYKDVVFDAKAIEKETAKLIANSDDDNVTSQSGIYQYIITRQQKYLSARTFPKSMKQRVYEQQDGMCPHCEARGNGRKYEIGEMEADHVKPWWEGGRTVEENCQLLCKDDNRRKAGS